MICKIWQYRKEISYEEWKKSNGNCFGIRFDL